MARCIDAKSIRYPDGRLVHFTYGSSRSHAEYLNRLDAIKADSGGRVPCGCGTTLASYTYLGAEGAGTVVEIDYQGSALREERLDLIGSGHADSAFDRFMRIVDQRWYDYGASADRDRYKYGYDRATQGVPGRIWRQNTTTTAKDEFYNYDGLHRLKEFERGDLTGTPPTGISGTPVREYDWNLDPTGNWETVLKKTSGVTDYDQDRGHNKVNEITALAEANASSSSGGAGDWVEPVHDRNGNMTTMPRPASPSSSYTAKYDGWNRMVEVKSGSTPVGTYEYDGLNRRISKTVSGTVRHFYYSMKWQVLEERVGASTSAESQHIFGPRYVDELVLRDRDTDSNGSLDERLYFLQDANFNVTVLVNTAGTAQERYVYEPYGEVDVFTGAWGARGPSSYANRFIFTGREYDSETGLQFNRNRYCASQLGRWLTRDPIGHLGSQWNLYAYGASRPQQSLDPFGMFGGPFPGPYAPLYTPPPKPAPPKPPGPGNDGVPGDPFPNDPDEGGLDWWGPYGDGVFVRTLVGGILVCTSWCDGIPHGYYTIERQECLPCRLLCVFTCDNFREFMKPPTGA